MTVVEFLPLLRMLKRAYAAEVCFYSINQAVPTCQMEIRHALKLCLSLPFWICAVLQTWQRNRI